MVTGSILPEQGKLSKAAAVRARVAGIMAAMQFGRGQLVLAMAAVLLLVGCGHSKEALTTTTTASTTTTSTSVAAASSLVAVGVRPGVLQAPFYPQVTITQVTCGAAPKGGRFVRLDLPAGGAGTPARSVLTKATAVIVVPGAAVLVDPRYVTRVLYVEGMKSVTTATQGAFVLTLHNLVATGGDGLAVEVGNVQVNGDYQCPATDVTYPGN